MGDPLPSRAMLLSVHPRHVATILAGEKTAELRRTRPTAPPGTPVLVYATAPVAAIVATCRLAGVRSGDAESLWPAVARSAAVSRDQFDAYFVGARSAHALELTEVAPLGVPVSLLHMRSGGAFHPPQTWRLLDVDALSRLTAGHPASPMLCGLLLDRPATPPAATAANASGGVLACPRSAHRWLASLVAAVPGHLTRAALAAGLSPVTGSTSAAGALPHPPGRPADGAAQRG